MSREACRRRGADLRLAAVATLAALLAALPAAAQTEPGADNRVVLRVNDRIVTLYDYQRALAEQIRQIRNAPALTDLQRQERLGEVGRIIMKAMFEEQLILSRADQLAVVIDESDVEQQMRATWERYGIETEEQFRDALAQSGMREEDFRARTRIELRANVVRGREVAPRIDLADEDLRRFYRENQERFAIPERARFEEVVILEGVVPADRMAPLASLARTRLVSGEEAAKVAEGLGEGSTPVDVGWVTPGDLATALDAVAWDLQPGDVAEAVSARGGLHVLKMLEREPASVQPFEDVRDAIEREERGRLFEEEYTLYMEELAEAAYIVERLPEEAVGYRPVATPSLDADALGLLSRFGPDAGAQPDASAQDAEEPVAEETGDGSDA
ncbi:MAG: peptidyl-prolyl cis-trans isomerase [Acidobacteriota bacterium]|nr:peptidyl-prolyl cis-trans isomerase [Acidobacteriota bacterium]MDE2921671.1 peptidyl-prolyl cis-trans isomerase [Acidobacteriota bacterium]MDE3266586.1 peptidyl-prolyl cis-trans isomerase [Acidobacteriota bacterium]